MPEYEVEAIIRFTVQAPKGEAGEEKAEERARDVADALLGHLAGLTKRRWLYTDGAEAEVEVSEMEV